jgi:hypothetical protein
VTTESLILHCGLYKFENVTLSTTYFAVLPILSKTMKTGLKNLRNDYRLGVWKLERPKCGDGTDETSLSSSWLHFALISLFLMF